MATDPSFLLKLQRARAHLQCLNDEIDAWVQTEPYGLVDEPDPEPPPQPVANGVRPRRFRVNRIGTMPSSFSLLVGDCVFNLRSALDHLALALARKHTSSMTPAQVKGSEFPIFHAGPMSADIEGKKIGCLHPDVADAIKRMQPYHRGNGFAVHPLWQIHEFNRIDKHQALTVCAAAPLAYEQLVVGIRPGSRRNWGGYTYWLGSAVYDPEPDAIFVRWGAIPDDPSLDVGVEPYFPLQVVFGDGQPAAHKPVVPTLHALCEYVGNVVVPDLWNSP